MNFFLEPESQNTRFRIQYFGEKCKQFFITLFPFCRDAQLFLKASLPLQENHSVYRTLLQGALFFYTIVFEVYLHKCIHHLILQKYHPFCRDYLNIIQKMHKYKQYHLFSHIYIYICIYTYSLLQGFFHTTKNACLQTVLNICIYIFPSARNL